MVFHPRPYGPEKTPKCLRTQQRGTIICAIVADFGGLSPSYNALTALWLSVSLTSASNPKRSSLR
jgi:hypothetical protein